MAKGMSATANLEKIKTKIRKLMNLGESPSEAEAAAAVAKAHELLDRYNLELAEIWGDTPEFQVDIAVISEAKGRREFWEDMLFAALAQLFDCKNMLAKCHGGWALEAVGLGTDLKLLSYFYGYLFSCLRKLHKQALIEEKARLARYQVKLTRRGVNDFRRSFMEAAVRRVVTRLKEARDARRNVDAGITALVLVKDREIQEYISLNIGHLYDGPKERRKIGSLVMGSLAGKMAADGINLNRPLASEALADRLIAVEAEAEG